MSTLSGAKLKGKDLIIVNYYARRIKANFHLITFVKYMKFMKLISSLDTNSDKQTLSLSKLMFVTGS